MLKVLLQLHERVLTWPWWFLLRDIQLSKGIKCAPQFFFHTYHVPTIFQALEHASIVDNSLWKHQHIYTFLSAYGGNLFIEEFSDCPCLLKPHKLSFASPLPPFPCIKHLRVGQDQKVKNWKSHVSRVKLLLRILLFIRQFISSSKMCFFIICI